MGATFGSTIAGAAADAASFRRYAQELLTLMPDVIIAVATPSIVALQQATRTVPIVFVSVPDPVGAGLVESLAHPGGNTTGFTIFEYSISGKWLELLKEIAPRVRRAAVIRDPLLTSGTAQFGVIQSVAHSLGAELTPVGARGADEIERGLCAQPRALPVSKAGITKYCRLLSHSARWVCSYPLSQFCQTASRPLEADYATSKRARKSCAGYLRRSSRSSHPRIGSRLPSALGASTAVRSRPITI